MQQNQLPGDLMIQENHSVPPWGLGELTVLPQTLSPVGRGLDAHPEEPHPQRMAKLSGPPCSFSISHTLETTYITSRYLELF